MTVKVIPSVGKKRSIVKIIDAVNALNRLTMLEKANSESDYITEVTERLEAITAALDANLDDKWEDHIPVDAINSKLLKLIEHNINNILFSGKEKLQPILDGCKKKISPYNNLNADITTIMWNYSNVNKVNLDTGFGLLSACKKLLSTHTEQPSIYSTESIDQLKLTLFQLNHLIDTSVDHWTKKRHNPKSMWSTKRELNSTLITEVKNMIRSIEENFPDRVEIEHYNFK